MTEGKTLFWTKKSFAWPVFLSFLVILSWLLYHCFAHALITAMYHGNVPEMLINIIKYQHKKPLEHYLNLATGLFYKAWLLLIIAVFLSFLTRFVTEAKTRFKPGSDLPDSIISQTTHAHSKRSIYNVEIIFHISLAIRLVFLPFVTNLPLAGDEGYFWRVFNMLGRGDFTHTLLRPPLWGYLLAILSAIFDDPLSGRMLSVLIGACAPVLVYLLAERLFNTKTALVAAILYAFYPEHIAYSHYLWAEILFGSLTILSVYFFVIFTENIQSNKCFTLTFLMLSITLLAREFTVIIFAGIIAALFFLKTKRKIRKILLASVLFLSMATIYSLIASCITKQVVVLNDSTMVNFARAANLETGYSHTFQNRKQTVSSLTEYLRQRSPLETARSFKNQFYNLWNPNSFPVVRLLGQYKPDEWSYGVAKPFPWVCIIVGYYICLVFIGLFGLCLAKMTPFRIFSVTSLFCLSSTAVIARLVSRFRLPFMFIFVIYAAHFMVNTKQLSPNLRNPVKLALIFLLTALFISIIFTKIPTIGSWG